MQQSWLYGVGLGCCFSEVVIAHQMHMMCRLAHNVDVVDVSPEPVLHKCNLIAQNILGYMRQHGWPAVTAWPA